MNWNDAVNRYRAVPRPLWLERRVELVLVVLTLCLVLQLLYGALRVTLLAAPEVVEPAADALQVLPSPGLGTVSAQESNEIRSRPLLWLSRRPSEAVAMVVESEKGKKSDFKAMKLVGIFGAGKSAGIIVRVKSKPQRVRLGEEVAGWKLKSVKNNEAVLTSGSRRETLTLEPVLTPSSGRGGKKSERRR